MENNYLKTPNTNSEINGRILKGELKWSHYAVEDEIGYHFLPNHKITTMSDKYKIVKKGDNYVAQDLKDPAITMGKINIATGKCVGATACFEDLREHLRQNKVVKSTTFKVWTAIEKHTEFEDGTDMYEDLEQEIPRSLGTFNSLEDAIEQE